MMLQELTLWSFWEKPAVYLIHFAFLFQSLSLLEVIAAKLFPLQNCFIIFSALCLGFSVHRAVLRKTWGSKYWPSISVKAYEVGT